MDGGTCTFLKNFIGILFGGLHPFKILIGLGGFLHLINFSGSIYILIVMNEENCQQPGPIKEYNFDNPPPYCRDDQSNCDHNPQEQSLKDVASIPNSWLEEATLRKTGNGQRADCDPMLKGHIVNEQDGKNVDRNIIYRYSKSLRGTDEAVKSLFNDVIVLDESTKAHTVPIIWGTQEKAVVAILGENYRKDDSMVVDRIRLPIMSIHSNSYDIDMSRYTYHKAENYLREFKNNWRPGFTTKEKWERDTVFGVSRGLPVNIGYSLFVWTKFEEDMNQITEQIITKLTPMGYIRVKGIGWEIPVRLESIANNIDYDPGDQKIRVCKYQFNLMVESYIAQPIIRKKSVLKTKIEITDNLEDETISEVIARLEQAVEEL